jgi:type I restriction enzyme S subunit
LGIDGALDLNLMALVPHAVRPDFLWWWMHKLDLASLSNGSNVPQINHGDVEPLPISLPDDEEEQDEISRRISLAFTWINHLATEATSARKLIDRLDQAVLAKAFAANWCRKTRTMNPQSVLLERIRAERAMVPAPARRGAKQVRRKRKR